MTRRKKMNFKKEKPVFLKKMADKYRIDDLSRKLGIHSTTIRSALKNDIVGATIEIAAKAIYDIENNHMKNDGGGYPCPSFVRSQNIYCFGCLS